MLVSPLLGNTAFRLALFSWTALLFPDINLDITCLEKASLSHQIWASLPFSVLLYHSLSPYTTYCTAGDYLFTSPVGKLPKDNDCVLFSIIFPLSITVPGTK